MKKVALQWWRHMASRRFVITDVNNWFQVRSGCLRLVITQHRWRKLRRGNEWRQGKCRWRYHHWILLSRNYELRSKRDGYRWREAQIAGNMRYTGLCLHLTTHESNVAWPHQLSTIGWNGHDPYCSSSFEENGMGSMTLCLRHDVLQLDDPIKWKQ